MNRSPDDVLSMNDIEEQYPDIRREHVQRAIKRRDLTTIKPPRPKRGRKYGRAGAPTKYLVRRDILETWITARQPPPDHVSVADAAEKCNVNARELYNAITAGELPAHTKTRRYGREPRIYVRVADVETWRDTQGVRRYRTVDRV